MTAEKERMTHDDDALFRFSLTLVAEKIPPQALGLLWTLHQQHGAWNCRAHQHGEDCCMDLLLADTPAPVARPEISNLAAIILAGYDVTIEAAGGDQTGYLHLFLSYQDQAPGGDLKFGATAVTLDQAIEKARTYAVAFPQARS